MEIEQDSPKNKKRPTPGPERQNEAKKVKHFNAKEFRKQLNSNNKLQALQDFLNAIKSEPSKRDCIIDYLQNGGTCIELLQTLEFDSTLPPSLVFEIVAYVLLKINASCPQYQNSCIEACRYVLNNYVTVVNKMLNLSSTTPERKACLKLLTAMVALSPALAKDVLVHVNFHSTNVDLLTKHTGEKDSVRDHFVRFLTAFLVDGHYPALSMLLEKKGFITSIIGGLQYDDADTLCMVISAMKNFILENPSVSRTAKMKTFNTTVVRDIVNLYNWKGPQGFKSEKRKNKSTSLTVDEVEKAKVNECVHDFLLVLCSSHKYGVIFKDHMLGLGKKNQNPLMYTVLESLERPWDHSYASELVTKICGACPDLAKTMWNNLKPSLEPRYSEKWLNAVKFAKNLIKEFQPSCIEFCVKELSPYQIFQVTQCLVAPLPIIKTIVPDHGSFENIMVKNMVLSVILEMLKALEIYLNSAKVWLSKENFEKYHVCISNYVAKNFPEPTIILKDWNKTDQIEADSANNLIENMFSIFEFYKKLSPSVLDKLVSVEINELLAGIDSMFQDDTNLLANVQIKVVSVFIDIDASKFTTKTELFSRVVPVLLEFYYGSRDTNCLLVLTKLFKHTNIFEGCEYEIHLWINGILDLKNYDNGIAQNIVEVMKLTNNSLQQFLEQLSSYTKRNTASIREDILEMLLNCEISESPTVTVKHKYLSPMILGLSQFLNENEITKSLKTYCTFVLLNLFHLQTDILPLINCLRNTKQLSSHLDSYFNSWVACSEIHSIPKVKGQIAMALKQFSEAFLFDDVDNFLENEQLDYHVDYPLNLLTTAVFYVSSLLRNNVLSEHITANYRKVVKHLIENKIFDDSSIALVLGHPILVPNVSFLNLQKSNPQSFVTNVTIDIIKYLIEAGYDIEGYLKIYRKKLFNDILKILAEPQKYEEYRITIRNLLLVFQLEYEQCHVILRTVSELSKNFEETSNVVLEILTFALKTFCLISKSNSALKPLEAKVVKNLSKCIAKLHKHELETNDISITLCEYLEMFPHNFGDIHSSLFKSVVQRSETNRGNIRLATLLLNRDDKYVETVRECLDVVCEKKSVILALVQVLVSKNVDDELLQGIFERVEPVLLKALQKPQKAGQHFHQNYVSAASLIDKFFDLDRCNGFVQKVQKYEVTEVFHVHLLHPIYKKIIDQNISGKYINNIILNLIHLQIAVFKRNLKTEEDIYKVNQIATIFFNILEKLGPYCSGKDLQSICTNESLKMYCKYCLKFGISGQYVLLKVLRNLLGNLADSFESDYVKLLMEMFLSHSEFLENVLGKNGDLKEEIMRLFLTFCQHWPEVMERSHLPVLFASYTAMVNRCDRVILMLLKMYESRAESTKFYDFKPFLWGKSAASHYSVRSNIENALWRQPKMSDVLDILQEHLVRSTITNYPLKDRLDVDMEENISQKYEDCYDLKFLLLVFSQLLAPEQQVQTYKFSRSGALSLTVVALSSQSKEVRQVACHVLSRFRFHLEGRQTGKDNPLWIRYIDAVCKGTAALPDFKLNNFAAIYLAKMAMVLTQPNHVMYLPLSQHLTAKSSLDFSTVPELYTFLHSPDVNFKEHRRFTLELLRDGLRTEKDFTDFLKSMAFKLISELYVSCLSDSDTKLLILDVFGSICKIPLGVKVLCEHHAFVSQLSCDLQCILSSFTKDNAETVFISKILLILLNISKVYHEKTSAFLIFMMLEQILSSELFNLIAKTDENIFYEVMYLTFEQCPEFYPKNVTDTLLRKSNDAFCTYINEYGCKFVDIKTLNQDDPKYYLRLLMIKMKS